MISDGNSTTAPLSASGVFTGQCLELEDHLVWAQVIVYTIISMGD